MSTPIFDPGCVRLGLRWHDGYVRDMTLRVERPAAAALLRGRNADAAVRMLPLLYAICGAAQGVAAALALAAARGQASAPAVAAAVLAEARREHLWRLLLDWPQALGLPQQPALLVEGRRRAQEPDFCTWAGGALAEHCARIEAAMRALPDPCAQQAVRLLPPSSAAATLVLWPRVDAGFAAAPLCAGMPAETGALARHAALAQVPPLLARVMARAADLADPQGLGLASAVAVAPGVGRAAVETARGLLLHELVLDGDRVADYVVVAPTEWNFHPAGTLRAWLQDAAMAAPAQLQAYAARAVLALDPCVRSEIEIADGAGA